MELNFGSKQSYKKPRQVRSAGVFNKQPCLSLDFKNDNAARLAEEYQKANSEAAKRFEEWINSGNI